MNLSQRKALDIAVRNGYKVTMQDALDMFFLPEDQDAFAKAQGWEDAAQMVYYESNEMEVAPMTDSEVQELVERGADSDTVARAMGYESAQELTAMLNQLEREEAERHAAAGKVEYLAPPPSEILVLMRQDAREVYTDSEDCPPDDFRDWSGVY
jgi:hypothetical protein